jgi:H+/Cl- antiporter ClcA
MTLFRNPRRARMVRVLTIRWQRRLIFVLGGVVVGAAAAGFTLLADAAQLAFHGVLAHRPYAALILTPAGFAVSILLTLRAFPNAQGSGIPQAIAARAITDPGARAALVSLRLAAGKILLTALGLACGASIGREGPTVQVGASVMAAVGRVSPRRQPGLILAGASAGVAAAFNTPLAGIIFGIEEMGRSFEVRASGLIIAAIIAAGLTSLALFGDYTYFGKTAVALHSAAGWLAVPVAGAVGGLLGGLFSRLLVLFARGLPGPLGRRIKAHPVVFALACGFAVALCGLAAPLSVFGTGYDQARGLLDGSLPLAWSYGLFKLAATALSAIAGIPGGIFSPSLSVGAGLGADIAHFFPSVPVGALILLGMVSYFAGVVQAPITAFVIVAEMTSDHAMLVPLMAAAFIAHACSRLVCEEGVYHALSAGYRTPAAGG